MVRLAQALVFCVVFCKSLLLFLFIIFHLAIVLSVSDDHFGIFNFFVHSCMALKEAPVGCGGRTNAQITLRSVKYSHTIKYLLLHNFRENRRCNQEWTIQRHWLHCKHKTSDGVDKQNTTQKAKMMSNTRRTPTKTEGEPMCSELVSSSCLL